MAGNAWKIKARLLRSNLVVLDEPGYLPFSKNGGQLLVHFRGSNPLGDATLKNNRAALPALLFCLKLSSNLSR